MIYIIRLLFVELIAHVIKRYIDSRNKNEK